MFSVSGVVSPTAMISSVQANQLSQPPLAHHDSRVLDLAFAMDTTGSMQSYIDSARNNVRKIVEDIVSKETSDLRLALVEYRDHPPQDRSFVTRVHDFTPRVAEMKGWLDNSKAEGGGDTPEAVADALHQVLKLSWRPKATKICVLISDAPPHGLYPAGDGFPNGCPDGHDPMSLARQMGEQSITLYVAGCEPALRAYKDFFKALAYVTGGQYVPLQSASALAAVITGGAQEEMSLEQWTEQVNQQVLAEVQEQGLDNVREEVLEARVISRLRANGARAQALRFNNYAAAPATKYIQNMSKCSSIAEVRAQYQMPEMDSARLEAARARRSAVSAKCRSASKGKSKSSEDDCRGDSEAYGMPSTPIQYETGEGEIERGQVQRMVQKALLRNKIELPKK